MSADSDPPAMGNVIDIHIHLEKYYPPDPTGPSDYVALGLIGAFAALTFAGNVALARIERSWKPIRGVHIPLVYAMTFFSLCHLVCVYVDTSFVPDLTAATQQFSCVATTFWGEYLLGLGGFLGVLGLRAYSLMMVAYDTLRPGGPKYRRVLIKGIFFALFLMPMYSLCLLITVDEDSRFDAELRGCETAVEFKVALVCVLAAYILVLLAQGALLGASELVAERAQTILSIIRASIPLLLVACIIHFGYMLPHYWGRLAFICVVVTLHSYAYGTLVLPALWDYRKHSKTGRIKTNFDLDAFDEAPASGIITSEAPLFRGERGARRMTDDIRWLLETIDARQPTITPQILMRVEQLRAKFFNYTKAAFADYLFTYNGDVLAQVNAFDAQEEHHFPAYRIISFYNDIQKLYNMTQQVYSTDKYVNADTVTTVMRPVRDEFFRTYLSAQSLTPVNLPARYVTRIRNGFARQIIAEWDVPVFVEIMTHILGALIATADGDYHGQFLADVEEVLESYGQTLYALDEENYVVYTDHEKSESTIAHLANLLTILRKGRAVEHESDTRSDEDPVEDMYDVSGLDPSEDSLEVSLQEAPSSGARDEQLADGAIIYTSPTRALAFFFYDAAVRIKTALGRCCTRVTVNDIILTAAESSDEAVFVHRKPDVDS